MHYIIQDSCMSSLEIWLVTCSLCSSLQGSCQL